MRRPSRVCAEPQLLDRLLPASDQGEHLRAGQLEPDRPAELPRRHDAEHQAGKPGAALGAEAAAEISGDHANALGGQAEAMRERGAVREHRLRRGVHGERRCRPMRPARRAARAGWWLLVGVV